MSFEKAFQKTIGLEGGYGCDYNDSGNWTGGKIGVGQLKGTKYGISAASYPNEDIQNLTLERAKFLYKRDRWDALNLDHINAGEIQEEIFDTSVNMGIGAAGKIAQQAVNFLEIGDPLEIDGSVGPVTIQYLNKWCGKDPEALFKALNGFQFVRYAEIVKNPEKERFAYGWMKRIQEYKG